MSDQPKTLFMGQNAGRSGSGLRDAIEREGGAFSALSPR